MSRIGEQLLCALPLQVFYGIRSERQLMEQLDYNLLYRWFVGLSPDDPVWDPTIFTKNRELPPQGRARRLRRWRGRFPRTKACVSFLRNDSITSSARGQMFNGLDKLVESTVGLFSAAFNVKSFTKSWLTTGFWVAYVYLAGLLILSLMRAAIRAVVDFVGWSNAFGLRNAIARERGIAAYRAWVPFERIRPVNIPQEKWEETFAWPANNEPPYPPLAQRMLRGMISYVVVILAAAVLLQVFTPFPALTWLTKMFVGSHF